ncbi:MAG: HEAT repeat domain-containing protein [Desulfobacterales bacterium]|nr:HEAT repeat domain-containing protein [Desulfobacterales bacterium]
MEPKAIKLNYRSAERFSKDYALLKSGRIFLPSKTLLPLETALTLNFTVPGIDNVFTVEGVVAKTIDEQAAAILQKPTGMVLEVVGGPDVILNKLNAVLCRHIDYQILLGLMPPAESAPPAADTHPVSHQADSELNDLDEAALEDEGEANLSLDWLRKAVAQEKVEKEDVPPLEITVAPTVEKKDLTLEERKKVKPSGEFLMDLTKAMLRSGYYSADHPGSEGAKQGLYEKFQTCLGESRQVEITKQETREKVDILITGILEEPVNARTLVGTGMAELFLPKLTEYFKRKALVSFAIKNDITLQHFESFVDIMSDPKADSGEGTKIGQLLSTALAEHGITEISTVFMDDLIMLELNLPWRVEMAIQRLAKDLKMLPMFQSGSDENIRTLKLQIIQDIIRPLRHPEFLKDLVINCYIIAKHVDGIEKEDIEQVIIESFPLDTLLPTSQFIFAELNDLREKHAQDLDNPTVVRRVDGVKRILKWVVRRLVMSDVSGAQSFLEELYLNEVLSFEELPPDVQYLVNTLVMTRDAQAHLSAYVRRLLNAEKTDDAVVLVKFCRRIFPTLFEDNDWKIALLLTRAADRAGKENGAFKKDSSLSPTPQRFIYKNLTEDLVTAYETAEDAQRKIIDEIAGLLGPQGIEILGKVLSECEDRQARKFATDALIQQGEMARIWVLKALCNPDQPWYLLRNTLMILRFVGKGEKGIERARQFISHEHPRVRDEALHTFLALKAPDAEQIVVDAIEDPDDKVQWRATSALAELAPLSEASVAKITRIIKTEIPEDDEAAAQHSRKVCNIIRTLGTVINIKNIQAVEESLLEIARMINGQKKGILKRLKKSASPHQTAILSAAIATLGKIGTANSEAFLKKMAGTKTAQAEAARKAVESIRQRYAKQQAGAPAAS